MSLLQNLPRDIIIDALSRLPVKVLVKFSFVVEKYGVLVTEDTPFPLAVADVANVVVVGEYNEMICIMIRCDRFGGNGEKIFYLWNPSSSEVRRADVANVVDATCSMFDAYDVGRGWKPYDAYGFGYDSTSDDYKIVKLLKFTWLEASHGGRSNFPVMVCTCPFVNGNCHWIMKKAVSGVREIVSFDLAKEKLEEVIPLPEELSEGKSVRDLNAFGGKLAVIVETPPLEIWVMDIYGVGSSWTQEMFGRYVFRETVLKIKVVVII
uniref:F-box domain-containing protein n=1 Tax=Kalanchoe fedtschenkoi TaxID=63787 RepID=A0A7N0TMQ1_KALFE